MNYKMVASYIGYLVWTTAIFLLPSVIVALIYGETNSALALLATAGIGALLGFLLFLCGRGKSKGFYAREGFVVAGAGWIIVSLLGALPFFISGEIPNFFDAFFESVSGFTTTGASILTNVEVMSHGLLFWRSFTHWLGGIGVLAFILAMVRTQAGAGFTLHMLRAESPGPQVGKLAPQMRTSIRWLFGIYLTLSLVNVLLLLIGGMPVFEALCTMFGTAGTGGFGIKNDSMASYSPYLQTVTTVFMALFGVNFTLYYLMVRRQWKAFLRDEELRLYVGIMLGAIALVTATVCLSGQLNLAESLHHSAFIVSSVITTTGFSTIDFDLWPEFARAFLLSLMLIGAMAGSTGGGFKISRVLILFKSIKAGVYRLVHPRSVRRIHINKKPLNDEVINRVYLYLIVYCLLTLFGFLIISLDGLTLESNLSAVISCINNIGPGLGMVGPAANYALYSKLSIFVLSLVMLIGRLEIFPILVLFTPSTWRLKN